MPPTSGTCDLYLQNISTVVRRQDGGGTKAFVAGAF
jgi:hypothetical protein